MNYIYYFIESKYLARLYKPKMIQFMNSLIVNLSATEGIKIVEFRNRVDTEQRLWKFGSKIN